MIPESVALAVAQEVANGIPPTVAGPKHGTSPVSGWRIAQRLSGLIQALRLRGAARWARKVLKEQDGYVDALTRVVLNDAVDKDGKPVVKGSDKAMAVRVLLEGPNLLEGRSESMTINGDVTVDQSTVNVDARSVQLTAGDAEARRAEAARLDSLLGL